MANKRISDLTATQTLTDTDEFVVDDASSTTRKIAFQDLGTQLLTTTSIVNALNNKQDSLTFDNAPTDLSTNPVYSGGVYTALTDKKDKQTAVIDPTADGNALAFIDTISQDAQGVITATKKNVTVDTTLTQGSTNPVSGGAVESVTTALNADLANKADDSVVVKSVNTKTPTNGAVEVTAEDIPADGIGDKSVSGNPIVIEDGMASVAKELSVTLEPTQYLHGYDSPWVAGASKNLILATEAWNITASGEIVSEPSYTCLIAKVTQGETYTLSIDGVKDSYQTYAFYSSYPVIGSVSYNGTRETPVATFTAPIDGYIVARNTNSVTKMQMEKGSSATSWIPFENICPIYPAGYDSTYTHGKAEVQRTGKNLFDKSAVTGRSTYRAKMYRDMKFFAGEQYVFSTDLSGLQLAIGIDYGGNDLEDSSWLSSGDSYTVQHDGVLTYPNGMGMKFSDGRKVTSSVVQDIINSHTQLEHGSLPSSYEPFSEDTVLIPFTQDVYGGTVDFNTGVLTAVCGFAEYDGSSDENWNYEVTGSGYKNFYINVPDARAWQCGSNSIAKCSQTAISSGNYTYYGTFIISGAKNFNFTVGDVLNISTVEGFRTYLASNPVQLVYELATPVTIQLTPAQLTLLQGMNVLSSDGTINLTYLGSMASNVQDEIDEFEQGLNNVIADIAFIENSTAKTNHAVGDYIILNGIFCKVIASISAGETLSFGTNIQATTLGAELKAIWAQISA